MTTRPDAAVTASANSSIDLPRYGASLPQAAVRFFRKYAVFSGRASRSEFWWWTLVAALVPLAVQVTYGLLTRDWRQDAGPVRALTQAFALVVLVPTLALTWRRLHDIDRSGAWFFVGLIPIAGWLVLLVMTLMPADPRGRRFDRPRR